MLLFSTVVVKLPSWNWLLESWPCFELFFDYLLQDVSFFLSFFLFRCFYFYSEYLNFIFLYSRFLLVTYFIHISVYMSIPISQFITSPPAPTPATFPPWCPYICSLHLCRRMFLEGRCHLQPLSPCEYWVSYRHLLSSCCYGKRPQGGSISWCPTLVTRAIGALWKSPVPRV